MKRLCRPSSRSRKLLTIAGSLALSVGSFAVWAASSETVSGGTGPDVTVIYLQSTSNYGSTSGVQAYSVGTTSCNIGDQPLWWCDDPRSYCDDEQHPVIAQNMYRLKDGRFEQIGMSWLKHGFLSINTSDSSCGTCVSPPHGGDQLGVGCTDPYGSGLNGSRPLGLRSEVNATTGDFPYPATTVSSPQVIDQRIQVEQSDLDPTTNAGARYWVEGHYVAPDDAQSGNGLNNASYREVSVSPGSLNLTLQGPTVRELPAIYVWPLLDADVELLEVDTPDTPIQRFHVARKVTSIAGGWHYEYAIHNLNSDRSGQAFRVDFPTAAVITNVGFHAVEHHSGEPYATTPWTPAVDGPSGSVSWATETFDNDNNANALRWGTLFNYWFDSDLPPTQEVEHTLTLFKNGAPSELTIVFGNRVFADGFESNDTSRWSSVSP